MALPRMIALTAVLLAIGAARAPAYRDLDHNGRLDPYEDRRLTPEARTADLLGRMTLEEKAGTMMHGTLPLARASAGSVSGYDLAAAARLIGDRHVTSLITRLTINPTDFARQNNQLQRIAEQTRLGIPVTISTDPRHHFQALAGVSTAGGFSKWPETLGFAALGDAAAVRRFAAVAAREYRAVGIQMALSPQADLATEPRWPRGFGTFGSDPALVSALAGAYVEGFQGGAAGPGRTGVATVVKHWVGYGAEPDGFDAHNRYGRTVRLDQASFAQHLAAFRGALAARSAGVMPTYAIVDGVTLDGRPLPPVGAGFNRPLLTDLLRGTQGFRGLILSDWAITATCADACSAPTAQRPQTRDDLAMPWGVETLSTVERFARGVDAGLDQFGGVDDPAPLLAAVREGRIAVTRIDESVRRILLLKFRLGLFDDPYVDPARAGQVVGSAASRAEADAVQRRALVLIENRGAILPLRKPKKVWLHQVGAAAARAAGLTVVGSPRDADVAIVRTHAPFETLHPYHFFGARHHEGRLDFRDGDADYEAVKATAAAVPTIVVVDMDRPAVLTNIRDKAGAIVAAFGASDAAVIDVLTGRAKARGRLPFELPSSMAEVERQNPARPDDTARPLYRRGTGILLR